MTESQEAVSVLLPTYNEAENIRVLLPRLMRVLDNAARSYEILVIDDASGDHTADIAEAILAQQGRVIRRADRERSLSLSILEGIKEAANNLIVVMDADSSHPPELIPVFLENLRQGNDLVIASRYVKGGGFCDFPLTRKFASRLACIIGRLVTPVKDNTSGFFGIRKAALEKVELSPYGFKIGLEVFVKARFNKFKEVPYIFTNRKKGKSKFGAKVTAQYFYHLLQLIIYKLFLVKDET